MQRSRSVSFRLLPALLLLAGATGQPAGAGTAKPVSAAPGIVLRSIRLFDPRAGAMTEPQDVLIVNDRIATVGVALEVPPGTRTIAGAGRYVLPGLFDCHTHLANLTLRSEDSLRRALEGFVRAGVTQVRDLGGPLGVMQEMARRTAEGRAAAPPVRGRKTGGTASTAREGLLGPEIFYAGPMLETSPLTHGNMNDSLPGFAVAMDTERQVDSLLAELVTHGARLVKTFGKADTAVYRHLVEGAARLGLKVTHDPGGQLFHRLPMDLALDLGVTCFEHAKAPWPIVLQDDLQREHDSLLVQPGTVTAATSFMPKVIALGAASVDVAKLHALATRMRERGAYLCPTLQVVDGIEETVFAQAKKASGLQELPESRKAMIRRTFACMDSVGRQCVRTFAEDHVRMLVGKDNCDASRTAREMRRMAVCGVSPVEILRGATLYPAEWLGVADRLGSIAPGMQANLVLLEKDPLEDIGNIESVAAVFVRGREVPAGPK
jgi:imidazolonepropionase-like amidohydrolase